MKNNKDRIDLKNGNKVESLNNNLSVHNITIRSLLQFLHFILKERHSGMREIPLKVYDGLCASNLDTSRKV